MNRLLFFLFAILLAAAVGLSVAASDFAVLPMDLRIAEELQEETNPVFGGLMVGVSEVGRPFVAMALMAASAAAFALRRRWLEAVLLVSTISAFEVSSLLKRIVARARPTLEAQDSFPSGHVVIFMVFFGALGYLAWVHLSGYLRWTIIAGCALLIVLVGPSRVYLGAHWPSDVAGGYLIGGIWLLILLYAYRQARGRLRG